MSYGRGITISKSDYMLFLKHPAWLWLKKNDPKKLPAVDANTQALFDAGHKFEPYAEALFPEGVSIGFAFDDSELSYWDMPKRTQDAIDGGAQVLFQPRFEWENFTCICDVVSMVGDKQVDLYEIKASTSAKDEYTYDLAFQVAVLKGAGYEVRNVYVIHVNNEYVRHGEIIPNELTTTADVTEAVKDMAEFTKKNMPSALSVAGQDIMPDPSPEHAKLGSKSDWQAIYDSIMGIKKPDYGPDVKPEVDSRAIKDFLGGMEYPLYFLDYETMSSVVPNFDGQRPYQQVPFQYSLHVIREKSAEVEHVGYLHSENSDPARPLVEQLVKDIGESGSVLVWYEAFEKKCNSVLGELVPEYQKAMEDINARIVDLIAPFKNKWYHDVRFNGSASIKQVLPVMCPELSYKDLGIQEGASAQRLWMEAVLDEKRVDEKDKILSDLDEYCKLDTLAMVEIYKKLTTI